MTVASKRRHLKDPNEEGLKIDDSLKSVNVSVVSGDVIQDSYRKLKQEAQSNTKHEVAQSERVSTPSLREVNDPGDEIQRGNIPYTSEHGGSDMYKGPRKHFKAANVIR